jgi:hypothetical protein
LLVVVLLLLIHEHQTAGCYQAVAGFGDDPNLAAAAKMVGRQDSRAVNQGVFVGLLVVIGQIAPIADDMPVK